MAKRKKKILPFFKYITLVMVILTIITLSIFKFIDILPQEYFAVLCIFLGIITLILGLINLSRGKKKIFSTFFSLLYIIILILGIVYELNTINFLKKIGYTNYKTENYSLLVLDTSSFDDLNDLTNQTIGDIVLNNTDIEEAKQTLTKKVKVQFQDFEDPNNLITSFNNQEINAILIEDSYLAILKEENSEFNYRVLTNFSIDIFQDNIDEKVNIIEDSFNVYISGIDTYGSISSVSRSDVNILLTVNPQTHNILITSIPRDYYLELDEISAFDKLTHSGLFGIKTTIKSVEKLLDTKINYYIKVNFTSLIDLVDALKGIEVNSEYSFTTIDGYTFQKGYNYLDGNQALSFVRERQSFSGGDRIRIKNQALVLKALINKLTSPSIIVNYSSLLKTLSSSFVTNIDMNSLTKFIKNEIANPKLWQIINYSLEGTDSYEYTYSYPSTKLYVMMPSEDSLTISKSKIKEILNQ